MDIPVGIPVHVVVGVPPPSDTASWLESMKAAHKRDMQALPRRLLVVGVCWFALWAQGILSKSIVIK